MALINTNSSYGKLRTAGILFIIAGLIIAVLDLVSLFLDLGYLGIIGAIAGAAAVVVLGLAMYDVANIDTAVRDEARKAGNTLIIYIILYVLLSIFDIYVPIGAIVVGILALIFRIRGFGSVNNVFLKLGDEMNSSMFILFGFYGLIVLVALLITVFTLSVPLVLAVGVIAIIGEIVLFIGIGIKLQRNATKLSSYTGKKSPTYYSPLVQTQPIEPQIIQSTGTTAIFCSHCGAKNTEENVKFCTNCGQSLD